MSGHNMLDVLDGEIDKLKAENAELRRLVKWCWSECERLSKTNIGEPIADCPEKAAVERIAGE